MSDEAQIASMLKLLADDRRGLREAVESVPAYAREQRPHNGGWSVSEILEHLAIIEGRVAMIMAGFVAAAPLRDSSAHVPQSITSHRAQVLDRTKKIQAPPPIHPTGEPDAATAMHNLDATRVQLLDAIRDAHLHDLSKVSRRHLVFGELNGYQWLEVHAGHEARHAAQIRDIANENEQEPD